jgi:hypothetical protein
MTAPPFSHINHIYGEAQKNSTLKGSPSSILPQHFKFPSLWKGRRGRAPLLNPPSVF